TQPDTPIHQREEAVQLAERAAELTQNRDAATLDVLAAAYAAAGRFDRAVSTAQVALAQATAESNGQLIQSLRERMRLYEQSRPYHNPWRPQHTSRP
ncbi:MAG: hypothetical protein KKI02_05525, partial [Planctomycetes bacterium]|nr:hypothetical protein [Planctomycetota bacterium]